MKQIAIALIFLATLGLSSAGNTPIGPLPVLTNFSISSLSGQWVVGLANDQQYDNYQRTVSYSCHTFNFNMPASGVINFTEGFFAPLYTQWNYWNRTNSYYYNPSEPTVIYMDQAMTIPLYYPVYQDATSILFMSNFSASDVGCNALGLTIDSANATNLYPIAQNIAKNIKCTANFFSYGPNTNLGCTNTLNKAIPASQANLLELMGIWNITAVWSTPANSTWSSLNCLTFIAERDFFLEFEYEVVYYNSKSLFNKWPQIEMNNLYIDPNNPGIWFRDNAPPYIVIYFNINTRRAIILSGSRQYAYFLSSTGISSPADIALFEAQLLQAGILANPLNIAQVSQTSSCGLPPFASRNISSVNVEVPEVLEI
jgi:hypothetical protein